MILVSPISTPADGTVYPSFIWRINSALCNHHHIFNVWLPVLISDGSIPPSLKESEPHRFQRSLLGA
jgi:hypothetical protein